MDPRSLPLLLTKNAPGLPEHRVGYVVGFERDAFLVEIPGMPSQLKFNQYGLQLPLPGRGNWRIELDEVRKVFSFLTRRLAPGTRFSVSCRTSKALRGKILRSISIDASHSQVFAMEEGAASPAPSYRFSVELGENRLVGDFRDFPMGPDEQKGLPLYFRFEVMS